MTFAGWLQIAIIFLIVIALIKPLGLFMSGVFQGKRTLLSPVLRPVEIGFYKLAGIKEDSEQSWLSYTMAMLVFSLFGFLSLYAILRLQAYLPLNPQGFDNVPPDLAFNTAISFLTNTNWQAYGGETTMSHFTQMAGLAVHNFLSAATGIALAAAVMRAFAALRGRDARQFLGRSHPHHALHPAATLDHRRLRFHRARCPTDAAGLGRHHDARRREADDRARADGEPGGDQAARHQWRRLHECQLRPSVRKSKRVQRLSPDRQHARDLLCAGLQLR